MRRWTPEEDAKLRSLYAEGLRISDIARRFRRPGRSRASVSARLCKLGIYGGRREPRRAWTREECDFLIAHYGMPGWTAKRIGEHLGRTARTVMGKAAYFGVTGRGVHHMAKPEGTEQRIVTLAMADTPTTEIARQVDCDPSYVWLVMKRRPSLYMRWIERNQERKSVAMARAHAEGRHPGAGWRSQA